MTRAAWRFPALVMFSVGYGANQFVPLLVYYRHALGLTDASATAIFGVYAVGLIPSLLVAGRISDQRGRRPVVLVAAALSLVASLVLITGRSGATGLYVGRLLTGVVSGTAFSAGTAWVKELSAGDSPGTGAKRAALALTAGFAVGPIVAGPLAQWAPAPAVLPYVLHIALAAGAFVLVLRTPETHPPTEPAPLIAPALGTRAFRRGIAPLGPWVFGSATLAFTTLPAHATPRLPGLAIAFPGLLAAAALGAGYAVQPTARRGYESGRLGPRTALVVVMAGVLAAAGATARPGVAAVLVAAAMLGAGYGACIMIGLRQIEEIAAPDELGAVVAVFYSLAYSGLLIPYVLALGAPTVGYPAGLAITAAIVLCCAAATTRLPLRERRGSRSD